MFYNEIRWFADTFFAKKIKEFAFKRFILEKYGNHLRSLRRMRPDDRGMDKTTT